jgi:hypothetical protein
MKRLMAVFLVGLVFLSFGSQARWDKVWDKEVGIVVVDQNLQDNTARLFATDKATGDLYSYNAQSNGWTRASGPARSFVSSGEGLFRLSSDGMTTSRYIAPDNWENLPGGAALTLIGGGKKLYSTKSPNGDLYEYTGTSFKLIENGRGRAFAAGGCQMCSPAGDTYGYIYKIATNGQSVWIYPQGFGEMTWKKIGGPASSIYAGLGASSPSVFAVDPTVGTLWHYQGGDAWDQVGYSGKMWTIDCIVESGSYNVRETLYGLSPSGNDIYKWGGNPDPDDWTKIDTAQLNKPLKSIHAGGGQLYAVASGGRLWRYAL